MIQVQVKSEAFNSEFAKKIAMTSNPVGMMNVVGRELGNRLKSHFVIRDEQNVNKLNPARREHFWLKVRESVQLPILSGAEGTLSVSVTVSDPRFAQKVYGGPIVAKNAGALTIPVSPEAYGRTARTFTAETGLKLFIVKVGGTKANNFENAVLAAHENGQQGFTVEYVLTKSVTQAADPQALPDMDVLAEALMDRADKFLVREMNNPGTEGKKA